MELTWKRSITLMRRWSLIATSLVALLWLFGIAGRPDILITPFWVVAIIVTIREFKKDEERWLKMREEEKTLLTSAILAYYSTCGLLMLVIAGLGSIFFYGSAIGLVIGLAFSCGASIVLGIIFYCADRIEEKHLIATCWPPTKKWLLALNGSA